MASWIRKTKQVRRLVVAFVLILGAATQFVGMLRELDDGGSDEEMVLHTFGLILLGGASIAVIAAGIRCRACGRRIGWFAMSRLPVDRWMIELLNTERCLACGDPGPSGDESRS